MCGFGIVCETVGWGLGSLWEWGESEDRGAFTVREADRWRGGLSLVYRACVTWASFIDANLRIDFSYDL